MATEKIEEVKKISKLSKSAASEEMQNVQIQEPERVAPNKERFDHLMDPKAPDLAAAKPAVAEQIEPVTKSSLMDEVRKLNHKVDSISSVDPKALVVQANEVIDHIETIKQKLATPNLEIKPQTQTLLKNKLLHIDENLRVALSKAGVEYTPPSQDNKLVNPMERFLGFLTHGQEQMKTLSHEVDQMHLNRKEITPANMLRIQIKVNYIQQEIEFFTAVLNKALESTKTIMNIQV